VPLRIRLKRYRRSAIVKRWEKQGKPIPPPHSVKQKIIEKYHSASGYNILIETGTYMGQMVDAMKDIFKKLYSVELSVDLWKRAVNRFSKYKHITIVHGDSGKVLKEITKYIDEPAIFWLDGHYSAGITAKGDKNCPIFEEIDAIFMYKKFNHILLIDDARYFKGQDDYPSLDELTTYIKNKDHRYSIIDTV
jgi:hypothetical protein